MSIHQSVFRDGKSNGIVISVRLFVLRTEQETAGWGEAAAQMSTCKSITLRTAEGAGVIVWGEAPWTGDISAPSRIECLNHL